MNATHNRDPNSTAPLSTPPTAPEPAVGAVAASRSLKHPVRLALLAATVLAGLSAGFFFTYEASVTLALADVSDATYVETFQAINDTVRNPAFGIVFFGSIPAIALAVVLNWKTTAKIPRLLMATALPLYLVGLLITGTGNVPLNNDLAVVEVTSPAAAAEARADFEDDWNQLNLLRSLAIGASFAALATASLLVSSTNSPKSRPTAGQTA